MTSLVKSLPDGIQEDPLKVSRGAAQSILASRGWAEFDSRIVLLSQSLTIRACDTLSGSDGQYMDRQALADAIRASTLLEVVQSLRRSAGHEQAVEMSFSWVDNDPSGDVDEE